MDALLRREGIELLGMEADSPSALAQVRTLNPDVVLVEGDGVPAQTGLMTELARLAYEMADLRIIRLSLTDEELHIYHQEQRKLVNTQDLVAAIRAAA
jgi:hypothetical protein